ARAKKATGAVAQEARALDRFHDQVLEGNMGPMIGEQGEATGGGKPLGFKPLGPAPVPEPAAHAKSGLDLCAGRREFPALDDGVEAERSRKVGAADERAGVLLERLPPRRFERLDCADPVLAPGGLRRRESLNADAA